MLKRVDVAAYTAAQEVVAGTFEAGTIVLGLAEGGVGYAVDEYNLALIPAELLEALEGVAGMIQSGALTVTDYRPQ